MEWGGGGRGEGVKVGWPVPSRVPLPRVLEPSLKVTVPVGSPPPGALAVTVAVNVTGWLYTEGFAEALTTAVVASLVTTCGEPASLPLLFAQPLAPVKAAVRVWLPPPRAAGRKAACPV